MLKKIYLVGDPSMERPPQRGLAREDRLPLATPAQAQDRPHPPKDLRARPPGLRLRERV